MSRIEQKNRELAHLSAFRESITDFPTGEINNDQKNPDFIIHSDHKLIGIEHTEIFHEANKDNRTLQAKENYIFKILNRAKEIYDSSNNKSVVVWVNFSSNPRLGTNKIDPISDSLVEIVKENIPEINQTKKIRHTWSKGDPLPEEIGSITIGNFRSQDKSSWHPPMAGFQPEVPIQYVQKSIDKKNGKVKDYLKICDDIWLLIVVYELWPSTLFDVSGEALNKSYLSKFDRTYLFDFQNKQAYKLKTYSQK